MTESFIASLLVGQQTVLLVHLELEPGGRAEHAFDGAEAFGHKSGDFAQGVAGDDYAQVVPAAHEVATGHLVEFGDAFGQMVEPAASLRADFYFDECGHAFMSAFLGVQNRLISHDGAVLLPSGDLGGYHGWIEGQHLRQLAGAEFGVRLDEFEDWGHGRR